MKFILGLLNICFFLFVLNLTLEVRSEETTTEKARASANRMVDGAKSAARDAQDKACEMVNGKMECIAKKMTRKTKTMSDKMHSKAQETKDKID